MQMRRAIEGSWKLPGIFGICVGNSFRSARTSSQRCRRAAITLVLILVALPAAAQQPATDKLGGLSLEQLLDVQVTSAASKHAQKADEAPSVITVVTADEIKRQGYRTVGDVLRTLPSFFVTYDRNYSYVGVRGFGRPGDYNTRILLLVDGARTNDNVYDAAYVAREFPIDVALIERVEVSRGPGASAYGNNAFFAVVNIVTKRGSDLPGIQLSAQASSFETYDASASYGRKFADGSEILASTSVLDSRGQQLLFPEFASEASPDGSISGGDRETARRTFASYSKGGFRLDVGHASRDKGIPTAPFGTVFGDTRSQTEDSWSRGSASYARSLGPDFDWSTRVTVGASEYAGTYAYEGTVEAVDLYRDSASGRWWNAETSGVWRAGSHTLIVGGEFQRNSRQDQEGGYAGELPSVDSANRGSKIGLFAQDDVALGKRLRLSLGGRFDRHGSTGGEELSGHLSPRLAVIAEPRDGTVVKLLYGSAFRAPNEYELYYFAVPRPALRPETIWTLEAAVEHALGSSLRATGSVFSNRIKDLITIDTDEAGEAGDYVFRNLGRIRSRGAEVALEARFSHGVVGRSSYAFQDTRDELEQRLSNSPRHMLKVNASVPLWQDLAWASFDAQYLSSRATLTGGRADSFVLVNATLVSKRFKGGWEAAASVYNVFDERYADPGSEEHVQDTIQQDGRALSGRLSFRF